FANTIAFNGGAGVRVVDSLSIGNTIRGNSIHDNTNLGIDVSGSGVTVAPPTLETADSLFGATVVAGSFSGARNANYILDFYASPTAGNGQGKRFLGLANVGTDATGSIRFSAPVQVAAAGEFITATAIDVHGSTSEFSAAVALKPFRFIVDTTSDDIDGGTRANPRGPDGKLSLREAITLVNLNPGTDTIEFQIGHGVQTISPD